MQELEAASDRDAAVDRIPWRWAMGMLGRARSAGHG
jgi:hypothetical protein